MTHYIEQIALFMRTAEQGVKEGKITQLEAFQQTNHVLQTILCGIPPMIEAGDSLLNNNEALLTEIISLRAQLRHTDIIRQQNLRLIAENNWLKHDRPKIVCLCGSTRFMKQFTEANRAETLKGNIVLSVGCDLKGDNWFDQFSAYEMEQIKGILDPLHLKKIKLADEVLVINPNGYIGESTRNEIKFAESLGKLVRYLEK